MENMRKHRNVRLATTERKINYLVPETYYHTIKFFAENLLAIEMTKTQIPMKNPVYLGLSISDLSKTVIYEIWYDYVKPKYCKNAKLCYMNTESFIGYVKADYIYNDISEDVETRFDTSNFEIHRRKGKNEKVIRLMKDEVGR